MRQRDRTENHGVASPVVTGSNDQDMRSGDDQLRRGVAKQAATVGESGVRYSHAGNASDAEFRVPRQALQTNEAGCAGPTIHAGPRAEAIADCRVAITVSVAVAWAL